MKTWNDIKHQFDWTERDDQTPKIDMTCNVPTNFISTNIIPAYDLNRVHYCDSALGFHLSNYDSWVLMQQIDNTLRLRIWSHESQDAFKCLHDVLEAFEYEIESDDFMIELEEQT